MDDTEQIGEQFVQYQAVQQPDVAVAQDVPQESIQQQVQEQLLQETLQDALLHDTIQEATTTTMAQSFFDKLDLTSAADKLMNGNALAVGMFSITVAILSFFVYKLISSINNRQKSKDKKKQKQKGNDSPKSAATKKKV